MGCIKLQQGNTLAVLNILTKFESMLEKLLAIPYIALKHFKIIMRLDKFVYEL